MEATAERKDPPRGRVFVAKALPDQAALGRLTITRASYEGQRDQADAEQGQRAGLRHRQVWID